MADEKEIKTYCIIRDGKVENVVLWDGESDWTPPKGTEVVRAEKMQIDGVECEPGIGWEHDAKAKAFKAPEQPKQEAKPEPAEAGPVDIGG